MKKKTILPARTSLHTGQPNPQALAALLDRYLLFMARQEQARRAKMLRGRNRSKSISV
jgi:stalled ribosome alternative rescue factor ArfA